MTASASAPATWRGTDVNVGSLEGRLMDLWKDLKCETGNAVVRTHIFNLLVYAQDRHHADQVVKSLSEMKRLHPSRTIVLVADRSHPHSRIDAELSVECTAATDDMPGFCHELATLEVYGRAADHLSSVAIPLLLPQMRTYLWWPGQPPFGYRMFHRLLGVADQLVVDSAAFDSPADGLANLGRLTAGQHGINDFNWIRLESWREIVTQFFDGPQLAPYARGIRSIRAQFGKGENTSRATASVLLLLGWIAARLGWRPETTLLRSLTEDVSLAVLQNQRLIPIELQVTDHGPKAAGRLIDLEITAELPGQPPAQFCIRRSEHLDRIDISIEIKGETRVERVVPMPVQSDIELLSNELETSGKDHLYSEAVSMASKLAGRDLWVPV